MMSAVIFAQYVNVDFEPGSLGAEWAWTVGDNGDNPPVEFVANPNTTGINSSTNSAMFTARQGGQAWALCFTDDIDPFEFNANNSIITIMVYKPVVSNIAVKFEGTSAPFELQSANTLINQWEEITFDFSGSIGNTYSRLIVIPDFAIRTEDHILYLDNIQLPESNVDPVPEPATAAPFPMHPSDSVISLFSNAYTDNAVNTWSADWDSADVSDVQIQGDDVKLYTNLSFAGIEFTSSTIDATALDYFHIDMWTPDTIVNPEELRIKLIDFGADDAWSGGDDVEHELSFFDDIIIADSWISLDIPLSDFTVLTTRANLAQLVISGDPNTLYVDNLYFYDMPLDVDEETGGVSNAVYRLGGNYPNPFNPTTNINYSLSKPGNVTLKVYDVKGRLVETLVDGYKSASSHNVGWNAVNVASGIYFYSLSVNNRSIETRQMVLLK